ncbi:MAG: helix-turn-helix domain-containing protein [Lachnospiraceae bacterium]
MENIQTDYLNSINLNADSDFPYLVLDVINDQSYPRNPGFQVMHWHEDLQFIYVLDGEIEIKTLDTSVQINTGSGIFINKNVIHLVNKKTSSCHYNSFIFPDYFLKFYFGSPATVFVEYIVGKNELPICCFPTEMDWCKPILSVLSRLAELENRKTKFYAYEVLCLLSALWLEVCRNIQVPCENTDTVIGTRMQKFLQYINEHYNEDISLDRLAGSANVSKSECLRCFKASLQTTPCKYLSEYRLSKAAELLKNSDEPIGNIADSVGFRQISHFGKCFKEKTGFSPRDYRKKK